MNRRISALLTLVVIWQGSRVMGLAATSILNPMATPLTITFSANDPDSPSVAGSSTATITFRATGGSNARTWNVQVQATTTNFGSCPSTVAANRVQVTCVSSTVSGGGGTGSCSGPFNLSTALTTVASGTEGNGARDYTVNVNFTFLDSWGFIATTAPCSVSLQYLITAN